MTYNFKDKVCFITGGSSGIGRATALAFAKEGAKVLVADRDPEKGEAVVSEIQKMGGVSIFQRCDVSSEDEVKASIERAMKDFGAINFAFNNAGIEGESASTADCTNENFDRVIDINLKGVWYCMKHQIPLMKSGDVIVNCSSIAGVVGFAGVSAYVASKHGVIGLTKAAAIELAVSGIRVNALCPGVIQTPMIDRFTHKDTATLKELVSGAPMGRAGTPEEMAATVLWLCSPGAGYVTGHALVADGGWVAH